MQPVTEMTPPGEPASLMWIETTLTRVMRRLMDTENLELPLLQLPLAQMRLAQTLYTGEESGEQTHGETMGRLSEKLGARQNAVTQAADRLVNHGLAERLSDPHDRRVVRLRLTAKGSEWVSGRRRRRQERFHALWALLDEAERTQFLHAVRTLEAAGNRLETFRPGMPTKETHGTGPDATFTVEETLSRFTAGSEAGAGRSAEDEE